MNKIIRLFLLLLVVASPALADDTLQTELVYRASLGRAEDVKLLLEQGASPNLTNPQGVPVLALASARADDEGINVMNALIAAGANINGTDKNGQTALFYAAREGNKKAVDLLLQNKINYYAIDTHGQIARTIAYQAGHQDIVQQLDNFVNSQTKAVQKQYTDVNNQLKERYKQQQEDEKKAVAAQLAANAQAKADAAAQPAPAPAKSTAPAPEEIQAKRETPEFHNDMHDLAYENCAYQYWYYVEMVKQSNELSPEELQIAISSHKEEIEKKATHTSQAYELDNNYVGKISANAKQKIFNELSLMPSNTYRHEQGVGKMDDMKERCELISSSWQEAPQPVVTPKDNKKGEKNNNKNNNKINKGYNVNKGNVNQAQQQNQKNIPGLGGNAQPGAAGVTSRTKSYNNGSFSGSTGQQGASSGQQQQQNQDDQRLLQPIVRMPPQRDPDAD